MTPSEIAPELHLARRGLPRQSAREYQEVAIPEPELFLKAYRWGLLQSTHIAQGYEVQDA